MYTTSYFIKFQVNFQNQQIEKEYDYVINHEQIQIFLALSDHFQKIQLFSKDIEFINKEINSKTTSFIYKN